MLQPQYGLALPWVLMVMALMALGSGALWRESIAIEGMVRRTDFEQQALLLAQSVLMDAADDIQSPASLARQLPGADCSQGICPFSGNPGLSRSHWLARWPLSAAWGHQTLGLNLVQSFSSSGVADAFQPTRAAYWIEPVGSQSVYRITAGLLFSNANNKVIMLQALWKASQTAADGSSSQPVWLSWAELPP